MVQTADSTTLLSTYQPKDEAEKGVAYLEPFIDVGDNSDLRRLYGDVGAIRFQFWPDSVTDGKDSPWESRSIPGLSHPLYTWVTGGDRTISFTAEFARDNDPAEIGAETVEAIIGGGADKLENYDIEAALAWLHSFQLPTYTDDLEPLPPPKLLLVFSGARLGLDGSSTGILCHLATCDITYQAFFPSGYMRHVQCSLTFIEHIQRNLKVTPFNRRTMLKQTQFNKKLPPARPTNLKIKVLKSV